MNRTEAVEAIISSLAEDDIALFTTGMISRQAFSTRDREGSFYMLGSMGLLSAFALGIALNKPSRKVVAVEGDGSALMSLGNFALIGSEKPKNLFHIVIDNESYESTGGQPTITGIIDLDQVASASSYSLVRRIDSLHDLVNYLPEFVNSSGPAFLLVKVRASNKEDPHRVALSPEAIMKRMRGFLNRGV